MTFKVKPGDVQQREDGTFFIDLTYRPSKPTQEVPLYEEGEQWDIEEDAPRWPDGSRLYAETETDLVQCVREALGRCLTRGQFELREHLDLSSAIARAMSTAGVEPGSTSEDASLVFLAGAAWAERRRCGA